MGYSAYTSKYLENDVVSRPKEWLVPLLYEHLLAHLRRAQVQIQQRDFEGKGVSLDKASAIIVELMSTLDRDKGGELAQRLMALYSYFGAEIVNIGRTLDQAALSKMIDMIASLHESWVIAARTQWPNAVITSTTPAAPAPAAVAAASRDSLYDRRVVR
jgi:flagellar protein FliS